MPRYFTRILIILVVCLTLILALVVARPTSPTLAASANITLSGTSGPPTTSVQIHGRGFKSKETIVLTFDTTQLRTTTASGTGTFSATITIPSAAVPGNHIIQAKGHTSALSAQATFLVQTNWVQSGFNREHTNFNPFENVLNSTSALVTRWTFNTGGCACSTPSVANGIIYFGGSSFYALNATTGAFVWSYANVGSYSTPAIDNGLVYFSSGSTMYALNATTGAFVWNYTNRTGQGYTSPLTANGKVYVGSSDGKVYTFDGTKGTLLWSYTTGGPIYSPLTLDNGNLYISANKLYVLNATTGAFVWSYTTGSSVSSVTMANNIVYVSSDKLYALNETTKALMWIYNGSAPAVANGLIYTTPFSSGNTILNPLNATTGKLVWSHDSSENGGDYIGAPVVANGVVYTIGGGWGPTSGIMLAFNATTGAFLGGIYDSNQTSGAGTSAVVVNGMLYVGMGEDPIIFAYGL
ncbi:MAG: PQQ-binding-like beta-propeller repeat protein [Chloroflexota bacterium]|nr:PQQ-binding-like beta-propeller repeat protein [Chloroflexota bacterium]